MASHLTQEQIGELHQALERRRTELRAEIREELLSQDNQALRELAGQVHDTEEESVGQLLVDLNLTFLDRHVRELNQVEDALTRIRTGTYGICVDTEEEIPYERLQVNPSAARTVEAQEVYERLHQEGHPNL